MDVVKIIASTDTPKKDGTAVFWRSRVNFNVGGRIIIPSDAEITDNSPRSADDFYQGKLMEVRKMDWVGGDLLIQVEVAT